MAKYWIGVDLDGTLARYEGWIGVDHIGEPVPQMADRVRRWLDAGREVRIFTARVSPANGHDDIETARKVIQDWTHEHFGVRLEVTCEKDFGMTELWDDRAVQVVKNNGSPYLCPPFAREEGISYV